MLNCKFTSFYTSFQHLSKKYQHKLLAQEIHFHFYHYESMKKSLLVFTEMGSINAGLAEFINYIAEHVSPRIAGQWDVQGAWCNRYSVTSEAYVIL